MKSEKKAQSKGRRKKTTVFQGAGIALMDRQWGGWGLLICLALALGLGLLSLANAASAIATDLSSQRDADEGSGAVVGILAFVLALGFTATVAWACRRLYRTLLAKSQIRLRLFTAVTSALALSALAFFTLSDRVLFYSSTVTVVYLSALTFFALWCFAANRSPN